MDEYYVYVYCDPRVKNNLIVDNYTFEYEPFYIGYGVKNRIYYHLKMKDSNLLKINKIKSIIKNGYQPITYKLVENVQHKKAIKLEKYFIRKIGTIQSVKGVKKGTLTNMTPGGDGGPTFFNRALTEEHKNKIRIGNTNKIFTKERLRNMSIAQKNRNIKISKDKKEKMLNGLKNMTEQSRTNISKATKNTIWIFNFNIKKNKRISISMLDDYLKLGWEKGFRIFN